MFFLRKKFFFVEIPLRQSYTQSKYIGYIIYRQTKFCSLKSRTTRGHYINLTNRRTLFKLFKLFFYFL